MFSYDFRICVVQEIATVIKHAVSALVRHQVTVFHARIPTVYWQMVVVWIHVHLEHTQMDLAVSLVVANAVGALHRNSAFYVAMDFF